MKKTSMNKQHLILLVILIIAAFLRFYNLNWGAPYYFHPDERNMAHAITQLQPDSLNPHFFAYGQFPLYLAFFSGLLDNFLSNNHSSMLTFPQAIFWLRFWSALSSTLTVLLVFLISRKFFNLNFSLLTSAFCAATPGLIQSAHFGTTESLLTLFFMLVVYLSVKFVSEKTANIKHLILISIVLGLAFSTKVSAILFFSAPAIALLLGLNRKKIIKTCFTIFFIFTFSFLIFILTSPYNFLDFRGFMGSMNYEIAVATGSVKVFYTRQFENTLPVFFQLAKIFPYALGIPIFILGSLGFLLMCVKFKNQNLKRKIYFIFSFSFLIYFLSNAFLFTKWTRFMTPIFPLFSIFSTYFLYQTVILVHRIIANYQFKKLLSVICYMLFVISFIIPGLAFFTIYARPDVRITASKWVYDNIPSGSYILSETANVIDIPLLIQNSKLKTQNYDVVSFNFYELNENPDRFEELLIQLELADYIFVPSRRIYKNHMNQPDIYPVTSRYYNLLFSGELGFEKVAEISSFPQLKIGNWKLVIDDENSEESFTVFDHPVIRIYKKEVVKNYNSLFSQTLSQ